MAGETNQSSRAGTEIHSGASTPPSQFSEQDFQQGVAVIGLACRVAGGNDTPEKLWEHMMNRQDASGEIPPMRWEPYRNRDARNSKILDQTTSRGYFVENLDDFDATFFGISPKEAEQMDPQQRVSLEVAWEALERAGISPQKLSGSDTSVFWGVNSDDFSKLVLEDLPNVEAWMGIGTAYCGIPNRISYQLNLMGPSTAVDAACAASLVAIHHGRQSILLKESEVSIVGGVNALYGPGLTRVLDKAGAVTPEGRCRSFDDSASGYGRGEGAGAIILKDLNKAIRDGDNILAVLKGSAVAQDGKTNGIMAPNANAQELVARNALREAAIDPSTIHYVECHATSTPLGDPTEVSAVSAVYGKSRDSSDPCYIGSVKPNIGHLEAGAGAMGFIKTVLAMQHGVIPPQANLENLNSKVNWKEAGVLPLKQAAKWPKPEETRRAAVSSYGYGGTVSHAVLEERYRQPAIDFSQLSPDNGDEHSRILFVSAPQEKRISIQAQVLHGWLQSWGDRHDLDSIASTLANRRSHHDYRAAVVVNNFEDALQALDGLARGSNGTYITQSRVLGDDLGSVWVFSGHGAQWESMGKTLLNDSTFVSAIEPLDKITQSVVGFSAVEALRTGEFKSTERVQVLTYIMQIGLSAVLQKNGASPRAIIGHSVGEIAASVVAGALTPVEGALIVCHRALLYMKVAGLGSMALVNRPFSEINSALEGRKDVVAAIDSSSSSCVISGEKDAVADLAAAWKAEGTQVFMVKTDVAFHSPMLIELIEPLEEVLRGELSPKKPHTKLYTTAEPESSQQRLRDVDYWIRNMVNPVYLTSAVQTALSDEHRVFLEVSTHPIVSQSINETIMEAGIEDYAVISTMNRKTAAPQKDILQSIAQLHCRGVSIDRQKLTPFSWTVDVPTTKWQHKTIVRKIETGPLNSSTTHDVDKHTLLGQRTDIAGTKTILFSTKLDDSTKPFPGSHPLHGAEIVPAAALVNTFHHATKAFEINNVILRVPVAISAPRDVQIVVEQDQVKITSRLVQTGADSAAQDQSWVTHTTAQFDATTVGSVLDDSIALLDNPRLDIPSIRSRINTRLRDDFSIDYLDKVGVSAMGFPWAITEHWGNTKEMLARVDVAPAVADTKSLPWDATSWAPILDAATSVGSTIFFDEPRLRMPAQIEKVRFYTSEPPPKIGWLYVEAATDSGLTSHVTVTDESGLPIAKFTSMRFSEIEGTPGVSGSVESLVHQMAWPPSQLSEKPLDLREIVFVSKDAQTVTKYAEGLAGLTHRTCSMASDLAGCSCLDKHTAIVFVPGNVATLDEVPASSEEFIDQLLQIIKHGGTISPPPKVFVVTDSVARAATPTSLAQSPLHGIGRIIHSEQPDIWGGLFDVEDESLPLNFMKYVKDADIVRIQDGIPRTARLRPMPRDRLLPAGRAERLAPKPEGTYLITGGLGSLGLEVADFLVEKGARRVVLVSRRALPSRREWKNLPADSNFALAISKIRELESHGASVYSVAVDIAADDATVQLSQALDSLSLPPVLGVVHAAGVLEDELILESTMSSYSRVLAPKIRGALALHAMYPPHNAGTSSDVESLDFFVLFSSCGQLFGFPGQGSYASGNAFLDALANHRRAAGDSGSIAFQWTSWRAMGMAASTDFISAELESKGITDVSRTDAFRAWMYAARFDIDHAVVLRALTLAADDMLPSAILEDIAPRTAPSASSADAGVTASGVSGESAMPSSGPELRAHLEERIKECVAAVLQSTVEDVDPRTALSDLGIDSVMTVTLRAKLQSALKIKVPPTITWSHPTVGHLVGWFAEKISGEN